jgi:hypothetical protein
MPAIDTADPFYETANQPGTTITLTSPAGQESHPDLPIG